MVCPFDISMSRLTNGTQQELWVAHTKVTSQSNPFYDRLSNLQAKHGFDVFVEDLCSPYYKSGPGRPCVYRPPGHPALRTSSNRPTRSKTNNTSAPERDSTHGIPVAGPITSNAVANASASMHVGAITLTLTTPFVVGRAVRGSIMCDVTPPASSRFR